MTVRSVFTVTSSVAYGATFPSGEGLFGASIYSIIRFGCLYEPSPLGKVAP